METTIRTPSREPRALTTQELRAWTTWSMVAGGALLVLGVLTLMAPMAGAVAAVVLFGWLATLGGIAELLFAWQTRTQNGSVWRFFVGAAYIITGFLVLVRPIESIFALAFALGVLLVVRGVLLAIIAAEMRPGPVWKWYLADGIAGIVLGVLVLAGWPEASVLFLGVYLGLGLLFSGVNRLVIASALRNAMGLPKVPGSSDQGHLPPAAAAT